MPEDLKVAVVGRNEIVREGLRRILVDHGFEVTQTVANPDDLTAKAGSNLLVVVDVVDLGETLTACAALKSKHPSARIALMNDKCDLESVALAFGSGAVDGYLIKEINCEPLAGSLRLIAMGEKLLPSKVAEDLCDPQARPLPSYVSLNDPNLNLSVRELDILRCLVEGDANKLISRRLHIADATVKVHIKAILRKLGVKNRTQAAIWAVNRGLTRPPLVPRAPVARPYQTAPESQVAMSH